jgi:hypothetical protein
MLIGHLNLYKLSLAAPHMLECFAIVEKNFNEKQD